MTDRLNDMKRILRLCEAEETGPDELTFKKTPDTKDARYEYLAHKGNMTRVIAHLKAYDSGKFTKLAQNLQDIDRLEIEIKKKKEEVKRAAKEDIASLFSVVDSVLTREVRTKQFIFTLSKDPKATDTPKYKEILTVLRDKLTPELKTVLDGLLKTMITTTERNPSLRLEPNESRKSTGLNLEEGFSDMLSDWFQKFKSTIKNWLTTYDTQLAELESKAGIELSSIYESEMGGDITTNMIAKEISDLVGSSNGNVQLASYNGMNTFVVNSGNQQFTITVEARGY